MKYTFTLFALFLSLFTTAQSEVESERKLRVGLNYGFNYTLLSSEPKVDDMLRNWNLGNRFGLVAHYRVSPKLSIKPSVELSFNDASIFSSIISSFAYSPNYRTIDIIVPMAYDLGNCSDFYIAFGPGLKVPIEDVQTTAQYPGVFDLTGELHIGSRRTIRRFNLVPELRLSSGLLNINNNPSFQQIRQHNISLVVSLIR